MSAHCFEGRDSCLKIKKILSNISKIWHISNSFSYDMPATQVSNLTAWIEPIAKHCNFKLTPNRPDLMSQHIIIQLLLFSSSKLDLFELIERGVW